MAFSSILHQPPPSSETLIWASQLSFYVPGIAPWLVCYGLAFQMRSTVQFWLFKVTTFMGLILHS